VPLAEPAVWRGRSRGKRLALPRVEHDLTAQPPHAVRTRFELAIQRMMDAWVTAGRMEVSPEDVQLAREFLEHSGWKVEDTPSPGRGHGRAQTTRAEVAPAPPESYSSPTPVARRVLPSSRNAAIRFAAIWDRCTSSAPSTRRAERAWRSMLSSGVSVE